MLPSDFLKAELENVEVCLSEALRYEYGVERSKVFFQECSKRLLAIRGLLNSSTTDQEIAGVSDRIRDLSALISRIERSHQGEFSWAFAEEIRSLGEIACHDPGSLAASMSQFFFSSDGGLNSYRIYPEQGSSDPAAIRLFNVVFPRTLKHHVLLHPILGHEIGHAVMTFPKSSGPLNDIFAHLFSNTALADIASFRAWLTASTLVPITQIQELTDSQLNRILRSWKIEIYCDLFGLVQMGPCFVGAHRTILSALDPSGRQIGQAHPPPLCRYWILKCAVQHLAWPSFGTPYTGSIGTALNDYWNPLLIVNPVEPWIELIPYANVQAGMSALLSYSNIFGNCFYQMPLLEDVAELVSQILNRVPPVGIQKYLTLDKPLRVIDFRTILFSGWLAAHLPSELKFWEINRLCDHAILQQRSINKQLGYKAVTR